MLLAHIMFASRSKIRLLAMRVAFMRGFLAIWLSLPLRRLHWQMSLKQFIPAPKTKWPCWNLESAFVYGSFFRVGSTSASLGEKGSSCWPRTQSRGPEGGRQLHLITQAVHHSTDSRRISKKRLARHRRIIEERRSTFVTYQWCIWVACKSCVFLQALIRDGYKCVVTGIYDAVAETESLVDVNLLNGTVHTELAHILPEPTDFNVLSSLEKVFSCLNV